MIQMWAHESGVTVGPGSGSPDTTWTFTPGDYRFIYAFLLQDGSEVKVAESDTVHLSGGFMAQIGASNDPPTFDSPPVTARLYGQVAGRPETTALWNLIGTNFDVGTGLIAGGSWSNHVAPQGSAPGGSGGGGDGGSSDPPPPPPPDDLCECDLELGPNPETVDAPEALTDASTNLLKEPPITSTVDLSQLRNRVYATGPGTTLTKAATSGARTIDVADVNVLDPQGGDVLIQTSHRIAYFKVVPNTESVNFQTAAGEVSFTAANGPGTVHLRQPLPVNVEQGAPVNLFVQDDDLESQRAIGAIEFDKDGKPTDGIHEYTLSTSLTTVAELRQRARAELTMFSKAITTIKYATRDPKSKEGVIVNVDLSNPPITGSFLIQQVTVDQIHDESDQLMPRYTVTASSAKFTLEDLLLKIIDKGDTSTFGGVVTAAVEESKDFATQLIGGAAEANLRVIKWRIDGTRLGTLGSEPYIVLTAPGENKMIVPLYLGWRNHITVPFGTTLNLALRWSLTSDPNDNDDGGATHDNILTTLGNILPGSGVEDRFGFSLLTTSNFTDLELPNNGQGDGGSPVNKNLLLMTTNATDPVSAGGANNYVQFFLLYMIHPYPWVGADAFYGS